MPYPQEPQPPANGHSHGEITEHRKTLGNLTLQAFELRSACHYALHPVEAVIRYFRAQTEGIGQESHNVIGFEKAEAQYRAGTQGVRLSEIPQLPQQLRELSRLTILDRAGRKAIRKWAEVEGLLSDEKQFLNIWESQGKRGGAEHQVYYDSNSSRWHKRLYHGVNSSTLGDYLVRMRLHAAIFPETEYRLEGFTINARNKEIAPVVSQLHVEVDTSRKLVSKEETDDLMSAIGFAPIPLYHNGVLDDGYYAYLHPATGVLAHDIHDENVVRIPECEDLAVIDPYLSLTRHGSWAALKLREAGYPTPPDDTPSEIEY